MLEDLGFYCIDNIPAALLKPFISYTVRRPETTYERTAVGLDARNTAAEVASVPELVDELKRSEEHTSELQSPMYLVCRLLLEKKKKKSKIRIHTNKAIKKKNTCIVICRALEEDRSPGGNHLRAGTSSRTQEKYRAHRRC